MATGQQEGKESPRYVFQTAPLCPILRGTSLDLLSFFVRNSDKKVEFSSRK